MREVLMKSIVQLIVIAGRKQRKELVSAMPGKGARVINVVYGKSSVRASYMREVFGFVPEENKVVITCLMPVDRLDEMFDMLVGEFHFNKPNTGIAFTIPIDKLTY